MSHDTQRARWINRPASEWHLNLAEWALYGTQAATHTAKAPDAPCPPQRPRSKAPKKKSPGEEGLVLALRANGISDYEREYQFDPKRQWKFDFAWPDRRLAVEIEGGTKFGKSRHSQGDGFEEDCRKYNAAAVLGWTVLRFSTAMVMSGEALGVIMGLLL
jgi:very-short-patch-repair endonuclease